MAVRLSISRQNLIDVGGFWALFRVGCKIIEGWGIGTIEVAGPQIRANSVIHPTQPSATCHLTFIFFFFSFCEGTRLKAFFLWRLSAWVLKCRSKAAGTCELLTAFLRRLKGGQRAGDGVAMKSDNP